MSLVFGEACVSGTRVVIIFRETEKLVARDRPLCHSVPGAPDPRPGLIRLSAHFFLSAFILNLVRSKNLSGALVLAAMISASLKIA